MMQIGIDHRTTIDDIATAKEVGDALELSYPGWGWAVNVAGDLIRILNVKMEAATRRQTGRNIPWGMTLFKSNYATASELKKAVLSKGGELLERGYMPAGDGTGKQITHIDMG